MIVFLLICKLINHPKKIRAFFDSPFDGLSKNIQKLNIQIKKGRNIYKKQKREDKGKIKMSKMMDFCNLFLFFPWSFKTK